MAEDSVEPTNMETPPMPRMLVLKVAVAVMGILLLAGFALVVTTIVSRVSNPQAAARVIGPGGQFGLTEVAIERGDIIRSVNLNEDRAAIHIAGEKGEEVIILNVKSGAELGRFRLRPLTGLADAAKR
ncbi:MAG: hypothetical protein Q7T44_05180 [Parvibaculum sp.]|nr:hypothetical protein [Parvibaculum sp.]